MEESPRLVKLELSEDDYCFLLYCLGYATGGFSKDDLRNNVKTSIELANKIIAQGDKRFKEKSP